MTDIETSGGVFTEEAYSDMISDIIQVFGCEESDIKNIQPIGEGLSNIIMKFEIKGRGGAFVYRSPGLASDILTDRGRETLIQSIVTGAGIDTTLIAMDAEKGWRISKFVQSRNFDYGNLNDMVKAVMIMRKLHEIPCKVRWNFDIIKESERIRGRADIEFTSVFADFEEIKERCYLLYEYTKNDGIKPCVTHGDCRDVNFLINDEECYLIDWEWGGYCDPGFDIGTYICGGIHSSNDIDRILYTYFRRKPSTIEKRHFYAYVSLSGWFYMSWTILKESKGQQIKALKDLWHKYAGEYSRIALDMYRGE